MYTDIKMLFSGMENSFVRLKFQITSSVCCLQVLKWSDCCLPLACSPGQPFRAVAQASVDNFSRLGVAFIEDRLQLDNGLMPSKIIRMLPSITFHINSFYVHHLKTPSIFVNLPLTVYI